MANEVIRETNEGALNLDTQMDDVLKFQQKVKSNGHLVSNNSFDSVDSHIDSRKESNLKGAPSTGVIKISKHNLKLNFAGSNSRVSLGKDVQKLNEHYEHMIIKQKQKS